MAAVCLVVGCHGSAASDAGTSSRPDSAASPLTQATRVELRDSAGTPGDHHDVVLRLEREGSDFAWTAKTDTLGDSLGEWAPDESLHTGPASKACTCDIEVRCECEHVSKFPAGLKRGRVAATLVDALLNACAAEAVGPDDEGHGFAPPLRRHLSAWASTTGDVRHFSSTQAAPKWRANGRPVASGGAAIDAAFDKVLAAVGAPAWISALNAQPSEAPVDVAPVSAPTTLPPGFAQLARSQILEVNDQWNGMGPTHHVFLRLERKGRAFAWKAKVAPYPGSLAERVSDPYAPGGTFEACLCGVDETCACEDAHGVKKKSGTVAAAPVEAFLASVAKHAIDLAYAAPQGHWSDDSPKGHVVVWSAPGAVPVHLSFLDQQRRWRVNGRELTLDPEDDTARSASASHVKLNASYQAMLKAIGLDKWIAELNPEFRRR